jgi:hypothetical protein
LIWPAIGGATTRLKRWNPGELKRLRCLPPQILSPPSIAGVTSSFSSPAFHYHFPPLFKHCPWPRFVAFSPLQRLKICVCVWWGHVLTLRPAFTSCASGGCGRGRELERLGLSAAQEF